MDFTRETKFGRYKLESISIKKGKNNERRKIAFNINGISFVTDLFFDSESVLFDQLNSGSHILCKHVFEDDIIDAEMKINCSIWVDDNYVYIAVI